jgi:hypothetical protein
MKADNGEVRHATRRCLLGLFAAVTLFAAAVMLNLDAAWYWVLPPPAIGMAALVVMASHVRRTHKVLFVGPPSSPTGTAWRPTWIERAT